MNPALIPNLPPEILLRVFDELDASPEALLSGPARVCSQWRALVRSHPDYSKHICLKNQRDSAFELFLDQLDAGYSDNTSIHLVIDCPATITTLLPHIVRHFSRCITFKLVYFSDSVEIWSILDALSRVSARKLQSLRLQLSSAALTDVDSGGEYTPSEHFPSSIFRGDAPLLRRLELSGTMCRLFRAGQTVPAFSAVESLEVNYADVERAILYPVLATVATPRLRRLGILDSDSQPEPVNAILLSTLSLDYLLFTSHTLRWAQTLAALNLDRLHELAIVPNSSHASQTFFAQQASSMRGPLCVSAVESARPDLEEDEVDIVVRPHRQQSSRILRIVGGLELVRNAGWWSAPAFPAEAPVVYLETCVDKWRQLYHVLPGRWFANAETLVLRIHGTDDFQDLEHELMLGLPVLRTVVLQLCPSRVPLVAPQRIEVDAGQLASFWKDRIGVTVNSQPILTVRSPLVLVGDRTVLDGIVHRIE